ncbi:hypothetical protein CHARACLAT_021195 [Characodon lateralis]|uniref:Uncharacterized protein n=1 Tax=Characodon lateralis TaxID=208331 RepID=A0ABU7DJ04_9TELE|nr:hypothetical protein [Characodon lateralis]
MNLFLARTSRNPYPRLSTAASVSSRHLSALSPTLTTWISNHFSPFNGDFHVLAPGSCSDPIETLELKLPRNSGESSSSWQPKLHTPPPQVSSTKPQNSPCFFSIWTVVLTLSFPVLSQTLTSAVTTYLRPDSRPSSSSQSYHSGPTSRPPGQTSTPPPVGKE